MPALAAEEAGERGAIQQNDSDADLPHDLSRRIRACFFPPDGIERDAQTAEQSLVFGKRHRLVRPHDHDQIIARRKLVLQKPE